ncbi:hypothetical protein PanWU01x14_059380, partial [Parasponia andersonii]
NQRIPKSCHSLDFNPEPDHRRRSRPGPPTRSDDRRSRAAGPCALSRRLCARIRARTHAYLRPNPANPASVRRHQPLPLTHTSFPSWTRRTSALIWAETAPFKEGVANYNTVIEKVFDGHGGPEAAAFIKKSAMRLFFEDVKSPQTSKVDDVGCGVANFGGALLDKNVLTMSFASKDEHEARMQFALERGIPATLSVIGSLELRG